MATTITSPETGEKSTPETRKVSKLVFDFETMEKTRKEATITLPEKLTDPSQLAQYTDKEMLDFVNSYRIKQAISAAKKEIAGPSPSAVWKFIAGFRLLPDFAKLDTGENRTKEQQKNDRKAQTTAIFAWIKTIPVLLDQVKALGDAGDEENDEDEDE